MHNVSLHCYLPFFFYFCKIACFEHSEHDSFLTESDCDTEYTDEDEDVEEHWPNICSEDVLQDLMRKTILNQFLLRTVLCY